VKQPIRKGRLRYIGYLVFASFAVAIILAIGYPSNEVLVDFAFGLVLLAVGLLVVGAILRHQEKA
jgi:hypothetical protein